MIPDSQFLLSGRGFVRNVLLYDDDDGPWLQPEWFDPNQPVSKMMCASPEKLFGMIKEWAKD